MDEHVEIEKEKMLSLALKHVKAEPLRKQLPNLMECRIVHDLGITGDDFESFYQFLNSLKPTQNRISGEYIPDEYSKDSYRVLQATSFVAKNLSMLRRKYTSKLECKPLKLGQLYDMLYPAEHGQMIAAE